MNVLAFDHWPTEHGPALRDLHAQVFNEPAIREEILQTRLLHRQDVRLELIWADTGPVAYKIGYQHKAGVYYSWIGGVHPDWRKRGLASRLMHSQHQWCQNRGYVSIRTETKNQWRDMLICNLRHGFDVIGCYTDELGEPKLILEKRLVQTP